jgi:hypothetical protein
VEIRRQTKNKKGLQDALRGILNAGGDMREDWELEQALKTGDRATGTEVLLKLYERMRNSPTETDLGALWKELGIREENGSVQFQDNAPLTAIRKSITAARTDQ